MSYPERFAILVDGGFLTKKLQQLDGEFPSAERVIQYCDALKCLECVAGLELLRIYFYDARPAKGEIINPISRERIQLDRTHQFRSHTSLLDRLEMMDDVALRLGDTHTHQWRLGAKALSSLKRETRALESNDLVPNIIQKGVDLRIGLDIARLALQKMVRAIVVVTADSDFVPTFKFARREGLRVYLDAMGHSAKRELKAHTDKLLGVELRKQE